MSRGKPRVTPLALLAHLSTDTDRAANWARPVRRRDGVCIGEGCSHPNMEEFMMLENKTALIYGAGGAIGGGGAAGVSGGGARASLAGRSGGPPLGSGPRIGRRARAAPGRR